MVSHRSDSLINLYKQLYLTGTEDLASVMLLTWLLAGGPSSSPHRLTRWTPGCPCNMQMALEQAIQERRQRGSFRAFCAQKPLPVTSHSHLVFKSSHSVQPTPQERSPFFLSSVILAVSCIFQFANVRPLFCFHLCPIQPLTPPPILPLGPSALDGSSQSSWPLETLRPF